MDDPLDLRVLVLLLLGGCTVYIAYQHPQVGVAALVAVGVVTAAYMLLSTGGSGGPPTP
ncbi:hypothetical protein [Streptomyces sp. NPDC092307]|uniref:hypothetical protein n=1 Tax=Streptomyces sp. NPDC092307 TaxID=3366013 RepID=UPI003812627C